MDFHRIKNILLQHTPDSSEWKGAVLFLCNEDYVFFIKRSQSMPTHSGQIAFFGGHKQKDEVHPFDVASREYQEETQLSKDTIECLGFLPGVMTARMQPIIPVLAKLQIPTDEFLGQIKSNGEWDLSFAYPWKELMTEEAWQFAWRHGYSKSAVMFHTLKSSYSVSLEQNVKDHLLWGATAQMIWNFLKLYFNKSVSPYF
jgi:8-oxo-dGTP pyrophosphatase MutT (NUDIX family)